MLTVNLFGSPGAGKSTGAAYIFAKLKMAGINCELIREYAKEKLYEKSEKAFQNQLYISGKQSYKMSMVSDEVDLAITDSPIILGVFYNRDENIQEELEQLLLKICKSENSINYFINRTKKYHEGGRFQTEKESDELSLVIKTYLTNNGIDFSEINGDIAGYDLVVDHLIELFKK